MVAKPESDPLFSVIIPTFGRPEFVERAVRSIMHQSVRSLECLVVDDGQQAPLELPVDERVHVVRQNVNRGTAAARNAGIAAARGQFVTFLDDDDQYTPDRLELARTALERADIAVCWNRFEGAAARPGRVLEGDVRDTILEHLIPNMGQVTVRREAVPLFDEDLRCCEDIEWWIRAAHELVVATVPQVGLIITRHSTPRHLKSANDRAQARIEIVQRHSEYFASRPRSAAFQWRRIGLYWRDAGDRAAARRAFARSLALRPNARAAAHLIRSIRPVRPSHHPLPLKDVQ